MQPLLPGICCRSLHLSETERMNDVTRTGYTWRYRSGHGLYVAEGGHLVPILTWVPVK